jgi:hypothetical protein
VEYLRNQISNCSKQANFPSQAALVKSSINSNCSSITMVKSNHSNPQAKLGPVIPQLDGTMNSLPPSNNTIPFETQKQCIVALQTCHKTFETEEQFHEHDAALKKIQTPTMATHTSLNLFTFRYPLLGLAYRGIFIFRA